jgi:hypothetical protein
MKKALVIVAFLVSLVAVVSTEAPYFEAGRNASADYESCKRACEDNYSRCMSDCANWQTNKEKCRERCDENKQKCNCQ